MKRLIVKPMPQSSDDAVNLHARMRSSARSAETEFHDQPHDGEDAELLAEEQARRDAERQRAATAA